MTNVMALFYNVCYQFNPAYAGCNKFAKIPCRHGIIPIDSFGVMNEMKRFDKMVQNYLALEWFALIVLKQNKVTFRRKFHLHCRLLYILYGQNRCSSTTAHTHICPLPMPSQITLSISGRMFEYFLTLPVICKSKWH